MPIGRSCVDHYRELSRYCVFSHDEMVCNMAFKADMMDVELASAVQKEMTAMVHEEKGLRERINKMVRSLVFKRVVLFVQRLMFSDEMIQLISTSVLIVSSCN